jgi:hypothetical protein
VVPADIVANLQWMGEKTVWLANSLEMQTGSGDNRSLHQMQYYLRIFARVLMTVS